jgi:hypothetical protein
MDDDFFSDLVPIKANGPKASSSSSFAEDTVLPVVSEPANGKSPTSDLLGVEAATPLPPTPMAAPMGDSRGKKDIRDYEAATQVVLEATLKRFAAGLTRVLEDVNRQGPPM